MSKPQKFFGKKILKIKDVKGYILIRDDGQILTVKLNSSKPETLASMMVLSSLNCDTIKATMGFTHYNFLMLTNKNNEMLFVFPIKNYYLGILYGKGEYDSVFVKKVRTFIQGITEKSTS